jgi:triacylglycerol lipase
MIKFQRLLFLFLALSVIIACKKETGTSTDNYVPVVFVHGLYGCGDSYTTLIQYFRANGYPESKLYTYDWNTLDFQNAPKNTKPLDDFIQEIKSETGYDKVNIVGHSLGGNLTFNYCNNASYAKTFIVWPGWLPTCRTEAVFQLMLFQP